MKYLSIFFVLTMLILMRNTLKEKDGFSGYLSISDLTQTDAKTEAFSVLREKCNICHATKKRTDIFTIENMDSLALDIQKQVFIKKKMPKGRKVTLTHEELEALRIWLSFEIEINVE